MNKKTIMGIALSIFITACSTPYQPNGLGGGYSDTKLNDNTYMVSFRGNGYTGSATLFNLILRRAADLTAQNGYSYFAILAGGQDVNSSVYSTPGFVSTSSSGNFNANYNAFGGGWNGQYSGSANSIITPPSYHMVRRLTDTVVVKMFKKQNPQGTLYKAQSILQQYAQKQ
jgi:hypothetical protein